MLRIAILSLVILMSLQSCDHCDPDVPSRPSPRNFVRSKRETTVICMAGQFYDKQSTQCQPCQDGYFMTAKMVKDGDRYQCEKCQEADEAKNEVEAEACTKTRDTLILCKEDFYRQLMPLATCKECQYSCSRCKVCGVGTNLHLPHEIQPCFDFTDTICCPSADMISENGTSLKPTTTTLRHVDRSTAQRVDTGETRTNEPTEPSKNHNNNYCGTIFANSRLIIIIMSFSLTFFISFSG